jgi:hypothetical protein
MAASGAVGAATSIAATIGRYFSVVSLVPAAVLVGWAELVRASGAITGAPSWRDLDRSLSEWSWGRTFLFLAAAWSLGLVMHGVQFNATQALEGYWGRSRLAVGLMRARIVRHRQIHRRLLLQLGGNDIRLRSELDQLPQDTTKPDGPRIGDGTPEEAGEERDSVMDTADGDAFVALAVARDEAQRLLQRYPEAARSIMPTRLGNAMRRFELRAGRAYGLEAIAISAHVTLTATPSHVAQLSDAREQLDLSVRLCWVGALATAISVAALATDGLWLVVALVPWAFAYLSYRGAVTAAEEFGAVFAAVVDLDRFAMYESLHVVSPPDIRREREANERLMQVFDGSTSASLRYDQPSRTDRRLPRPVR